MPELHWQIKKLQALQEKCGTGDKKKDKPAVDMSKMTAYEKSQYLLAEQMQRIRNNILELDNLPEGAPAAKRVELKQSIRKDTMKLEDGAKEARRCAKDEGRKEEYEKLIQHVKKTQNLWNARHQSEGVRDAADSMSPRSSGNGIQKLDEEMSQLGQPMMNLHEDQEFQLFFDQVSKRDEEIDQALDQISAGVTVLHQQAKQMNTELKVQKELINTAEQKMDNVTDQLTGLNKKLKKTIKEVNKDRLCLYLICCILLIALAGTIYFVMKEN